MQEWGDNSWINPVLVYQEYNKNNHLLTMFFENGMTDYLVYPGNDMSFKFDKKFGKNAIIENVFYDVLVFFSPSGIESLLKNFPDFKQNNTRIAAFGNSTINAVTEAGLKCDIQAPSPETPSMTMALEKYIRQANKK